MKHRRLFVKLGAVVVTLAMAISMGGPVTQAAAQPILVDQTNPAFGCGSYDGDSAFKDPVVAINGAVSGQTVVICPGTYILAGTITISGKNKVTIKRALTDAGSRPILTVDPAAAAGIDVSNSTGLTIDGVILDARTHDPGSYTGINLDHSSAVIKNSALIGPDGVTSSGISLDASGQSTVSTLSVTNTSIAGYSSAGVAGMGPVKVTVTSCHLDATDGGRVGALNSLGVYIAGTPDPIGPAVSVTKSRIVNNWAGVYITNASKISVSSNLLLDNRFGLEWLITNFRSGDNTKITGNTFLGIPANGAGVDIVAGNPNLYSVKKMTISKNIFAAGAYTPTGAGARGIAIFSTVFAPTMVTGTISSNTFWAFSPARNINLTDASLKQSGNDATP